MKFPRHDRQLVAAALAEEGMSTRAIGSALNVDHKTISNDLRESGEEFSSPAQVTGLDGKTYQTSAAGDEPTAADTEPPRPGTERTEEPAEEADEGPDASTQLLYASSVIKWLNQVHKRAGVVVEHLVPILASEAKMGGPENVAANLRQVGNYLVYAADCADEVVLGGTDSPPVYDQNTIAGEEVRERNMPGPTEEEARAEAAERAKSAEADLAAMTEEMSR